MYIYIYIRSDFFWLLLKTQIGVDHFENDKEIQQVSDNTLMVCDRDLCFKYEMIQYLLIYS